jgi:uncharacterized protein YdbL (DUF1318 family)
MRMQHSFRRFVSHFVMAFAVVFASSASAQTNEGWRPLFNGKNLDGWYVYIRGQGKDSDTNKLVQVNDGAVHMYKDVADKSNQPFGYICTEQEYSDYHLRFEYKWGQKRFGGRADKKRDAGLLYHVVGPDNVWPRSVECQIQEGDTGDVFAVRTQVTTTVDPNKKGALHFMETADGGMPVTQGKTNGNTRVVKSVNLEKDGWNTVEAIVRGDTAVHIINGKVNNRVSEMKEMIDGEWRPLTKGKILLQLEGAELFYRNIELKPLSAETPKK